jgi:DNA polymerase elongation subunit (family B)
MQDFYTNIYQSKKNLMICGYRDGKRYKQIIPYRPYLFLQSKKDDVEYRTIFNEPVERIDFDSISDAKEFIKKYDDVKNFKIYGLDKFLYVWINDNFPGDIHYDSSQIKIWNIDIETGKTEEGRFADASIANGPIRLIGIGINGQKIQLGYKECNLKRSDVKYIKCKDEEDMLEKFLNLCQSDDYRADVWTGYNIENYDVVFIYNRIKRVLGDEAVKKLSTWNIVNERTIESRGQETVTYTPVGVSILDYYQLYRKFTQNQLDSWTLDNVAFVETGKRKLDYSEYESLDELYEKDFDKYCDYNAEDIDRVYDIDQKKKLLDLAFAMAYDAKVNYIDMMGSVHYWDILIHNFLMRDKIVIPPYESKEQKNIPGAFVKDPKPGFYNWAVSFDFTSLYPKLIESFNISPETLIDFEDWIKISDADTAEDFDFSEIDKLLLGFEEGKSLKHIQSRAANGAEFRKDVHGFFPRLMKEQFNKRTESKKKMIQAEKDFERTKDPQFEKEIDRYYNIQWAKKIQLNSLYGASANRGFRFYNWKIASAITVSGQLAIRWMERNMNKYLNGILKTNNIDYVVAVDTDSIIVNMDPLVQKCVKDPTDKNKVINFLDKVSEQEIQKEMNRWCKELIEHMNAYENALHMKREVIADRSIWLAKKRYIMNVWDKEGVRHSEPELKMMGIEAVRSSTPAVCKAAIKETLKIIMSKTEDDAIEYIENFKKKFYEQPFEEVAFPRGVNGMEKYGDPVTVYKKGTPIHVRGSLVYNMLLKKTGLDKKFPQIYEKDKIKFCYLKLPNYTQSNIISCPKVLPKELNLDKYIDYEVQFQKTFLDPINAILTAINWKSEKTSNLEGWFD